VVNKVEYITFHAIIFESEPLWV